MLKLFLAVAPYILSAPTQTIPKKIARRLMAFVLFALSCLTFLVAIFILITSYYGAAIGFLSVSGFFLFTGLIFFYSAKRRRRTSNEKISHTQSADPIASFLPNSIVNTPTISRLVQQISENPVATSVGAAGIAMLLTRELSKN